MEKLIGIATAILAGIGTTACLSTIGILGYALIDKEPVNLAEESSNTLEVQMEDYSSTVPQVFTTFPDSVDIEGINYVEHTHNYIESVDVKANCYREGRLKYICDICGNTYYIDVPATKHKEDFDWITVREPTSNEAGLRVKYCIYCDSIAAIEDIPHLNNGVHVNDEEHVHSYAVTTEREPTCVLTGLRKYTCSCGDIYSEQISVPGHIATDWTTVEEPTTTTLGAEQRTCTVCGILLDLRRIAVKEVLPSPSSDASSDTNISLNTPTPAATIRPQSTPTALPKPTNAPVDTPRPTGTPRPTSTPQPVITPKPTNTPTHTGNPDYDWQKKVIDAAKNYLASKMGYSRDSLKKMLEDFDKFSPEQADYGVDKCGADWNSEAAIRAKRYLDTEAGYSYEFLKKMLNDVDKFTSEQADYGVDKCGADWNIQAVISANNYLATGIEFSYDSLKKMLEDVDKFTSEQAEYGVDNCDFDW